MPNKKGHNYQSITLLLLNLLPKLGSNRRTVEASNRTNPLMNSQMPWGKIKKAPDFSEAFAPEAGLESKRRTAPTL